VKDALAGAALTALVSGLVWGVWGRDAAVASAVFGVIATALHVPAAVVFKRGLTDSFSRTFGFWMAGMGLRMVGVVAFVVAVSVAPERFPALPTAIGFLGVLVPLLFSEIRLLK
jgi:hypothetical protein